ncbi:hypothetical protein Lcho_2250 [Leptothrix cholodnii SP-6]|uniref:Transcriptional regulator, LuxR family n=1 Tax=Leptothrix cholodnii (strain ATCC 51168 / LMG 8142 / SP-6) TaxID=395495 RepID=B1Y3I8_LEPCP|nr:hypothetical protein [Leptothrix cholodnii]ACB34516.1 hypothetical protein Lcho_2250 [Leptothrix cholodnii SP-6]
MSEPVNPPWGLSPGQAAAVQAVIDTGCNKGAARLRDVSVKTIEVQAGDALRKSGKSNRLQMLIAFDRHMRGAA